MQDLLFLNPSTMSFIKENQDLQEYIIIFQQQMNFNFIYLRICDTGNDWICKFYYYYNENEHISRYNPNEAKKFYYFFNFDLIMYEYFFNMIIDLLESDIKVKYNYLF